MTSSPVRRTPGSGSAHPADDGTVGMLSTLDIARAMDAAR
jgi:hypothetical protein